ncbi:hypothetical protein ACFV7Q_02345 [Streptomyces sp. NPDC059851]|uniref:hypothetical protein n=1 Tax=Streptomyces sp. NPDC059851 TaxID=3346971 RepID=UPI003652D7F3
MGTDRTGRDRDEAWRREFAGRDRMPEPRPADRLPAGPARRPPEARPTARAEQPEGLTQIHEPGPLPVDPELPDRDACWQRLPDDARAKTLEKAGTVLLWWAHLTEDRAPFAVVLGDRGLCRLLPAEPERPAGRLRNMLSTSPAREYRGERVRLEPGTLRSRSFDGSPPAAAAAAGGLTVPGRAGSPVERLALDPAEAQDVLGHFPLDVQDFLQRPFLSGKRSVRADWYYYETVEPEHTALFLVMCLTDERHVTAIEARRTLAHGAGPDRARWHAITCHGARLVRR